MILSIFSGASVQELIGILHTMTIWNLEGSAVKLFDCTEDINKMGEIIDAYEESNMVNMSSRLVNGIIFFYDGDNGLELTDGIVWQLETFS